MVIAMIPLALGASAALTLSGVLSGFSPDGQVYRVSVEAPVSELLALSGRGGAGDTNFRGLIEERVGEFGLELLQLGRLEPALTKTLEAGCPPADPQSEDLRRARPRPVEWVLREMTSEQLDRALRICGQFGWTGAGCVPEICLGRRVAPARADGGCEGARTAGVGGARCRPG